LHCSDSPHPCRIEIVRLTPSRQIATLLNNVHIRNPLCPQLLLDPKDFNSSLHTLIKKEFEALVRPATPLIHGARSTLWHAKHKEDRLSRWMTGLSARRHPNVAAVALANKTVRMAWAMMKNESDYDPEFALFKATQ
jgi:hypothetical protein